MPFWTVQCSYAAYYARTETVEADTLDEALDRAIEASNASCGWYSQDVSGNTFIDAAALGDDVDLWTDAVEQQSIPARFSEQGAPPRITIIVSGGVVQDVCIEGGKARVHIHDYDTDGADPSDPSIQTDEAGDRYALADWSNEHPLVSPAESSRAGTRASPEER